jgi:sugar lactone lactonase YvrE
LVNRIRRLHAPRCEVGEGPSYDPVTDTLWWFDISGSALYEHSFLKDNTARHDLPDFGSVLARTDRDIQMIAMNGGLWLRDPDTGSLTSWVTLNGGKDDNLFTNDGRVHPSGALWISSMSRDSEPGRGRIYVVTGSAVHPLYDGLTTPNSICFAPDGRTAYWCDSDDKRIYATPTDPATGLPTGPAALFDDSRSRPGIPDGAVVDQDGTLWSARWGAGVVEAIGADGRLRDQIAFPVQNLTCPVFIGAAANGIAVTSCYWSARPGTDDGATFVLPDGFRGVHDPVFRLG